MAQLHRITFRGPDRHPSYPSARHDVHCPKLAQQLAEAMRQNGYTVTVETVWA